MIQDIYDIIFLRIELKILQVSEHLILLYIMQRHIYIYIFVARKMSVRGITPKLIDLQLKMIHHWIRLIAASIY